jgi:hypothetical protein
MAHLPITPQQPTRRSMKSAALGSLAAIAAPHVKSSYAAGTLMFGAVDHLVPGANNALTVLCNEWGAKNNVEVKINYITPVGEKDKLTAAAEAQAGTGHDIMSHRDWMIGIYAMCSRRLTILPRNSSSNTARSVRFSNIWARSKALGARYLLRG